MKKTLILSVIALSFILAKGQVTHATTDVVAIDAVVNPKVTICHRDNNVKQPWGPKAQEVAADSADGDTGNDNGQGDHSEHTGPIPATEVEAQALKDAKQEWGDIIPPHDNYAGLNWTALGEAIWKNDCQFTGFGGGSNPPETPATTVITPASVQTLPNTASNGQTNALVALSLGTAAVAGTTYALRKRLINE